MTHNLSNQAYLTDPVLNAMNADQSLQRLIATTSRERQASKAGKMMAIFKQSPARFVMTFQEFQKPSKRNRILRDYGMLAIVLPGEGKKPPKKVVN